MNTNRAFKSVGKHLPILGDTSVNVAMFSNSVWIAEN